MGGGVLERGIYWVRVKLTDVEQVGVKPGIVRTHFHIEKAQAKLQNGGQARNAREKRQRSVERESKRYNKVSPWT